MILKRGTSRSLTRLHSTGGFGTIVHWKLLFLPGPHQSESKHAALRRSHTIRSTSCGGIAKRGCPSVYPKVPAKTSCPAVTSAWAVAGSVSMHRTRAISTAAPPTSSRSAPGNRLESKVISGVRMRMNQGGHIGSCSAPARRGAPGGILAAAINRSWKQAYFIP